MKKLLLTSLPVFFTGTFIFGQSSSYQATVKILFEGNPSAVQISKAILKYNKDFAYSFTFDDGKGDVYRNVLPFFEGGTIADKNLNFPGLTYSDGCGNQVNFKGGIAMNSVNSAGEDVHDGNHEQSISWEQLKELYSKGWNVFNHSYSHASGAGTNYAFEISENTSYIESKTNIKTTHFVVPSGDSNYVPEAFNQGMKAVYNQQSSFPGSNGLKVEDLTDMSQFRFFRRYVSDERFDESNIREKIDEIASQSSPTNHLWFTDFTHSVSFEPTGGSILFSTFQNYMNYVENTYGSKGTDIMWMAPLQEVYEYIVVRNMMTYTSEISGDTLILHLNFGSVPKDLDQYSISFNVSSENNFTNIITNNIESFSYKGSGNAKLININFKNDAVISSNTHNKLLSDCKEDLSVYYSRERQLLVKTKGNAGEPLSIIVYDNKGVVLLNCEHTCSGEFEEIKLPTDLPQGIYFLKAFMKRSNCGNVRRIYIY